MTLAARIQESIRAVNAGGRDAVPAGEAYVLYRDPRSDHPYLNYAVPVADAPAWNGVDALRGAFAAHGLRPRLEFVAQCAPGLEEALAAAGFELEARIPVMTCEAMALQTVPAPDGVVIARVLEAADARPLLEVARAAFGEPPPSDDDLAGYAGHGFLARAGGAPAGAAFRTAIAEGVSEIAGIGVLERFRRRGIGAALTAAAAADAFADDAQLCFLTPGDDGARRTYERAGFTAAATMVHMVG
jgi:ribosomal protein S18 acetylase RimI-like enzyme